MLDKNDDLYRKSAGPTQHDIDQRLRATSREDMLKLSTEERLRWFYLRQVRHPELKRVARDVSELLQPDNEVRIISLIGMAGIGKTSLASLIAQEWANRKEAAAGPGEIPAIYVKAPANGNNHVSWNVLYTRIMEAGSEVLIARKRAGAPMPNLAPQAGLAHDIRSLSGKREFLERLFTHRNVQAVFVDEAVHLHRFDKHDRVMDTLKSLADIHKTKLVLLGSYDIAPLMIEYGQIARRSEIVHYRRYQASMTWAMGAGRKSGRDVFADLLKAMCNQWPSERVPNLAPHVDDIMKASLGSAGLLKSMLLRAAARQLTAKNEILPPSAWGKCAKSKKAVQKLDAEAAAGEALLEGACYGDSMLATLRVA